MSLFDIYSWFEGKNAEDYCENLSNCLMVALVVLMILLFWGLSART